MYQNLRTGSLVLFTLTILTGVVYPAFVTGVAQTIFPNEANGSIIHVEGLKRGSVFIGQAFSRPEYFWSRISATSSVPYDASASGGSNLGPMNPALIETVKARIADYSSGDAVGRAVPVDLVTSSASGLDPHISPAAANFQVVRVAAARAISEDLVRQLVLSHTEGRTMGLLGEPRVNVVLLNLALDRVQQEQKE